MKKLFCAAALLLPLLCACAPQGGGRIALRVVDGWTEEPISGAMVVVPEGSLSCQTDAAGRVVLRDVLVVPDATFRQILPQEFGTVTILTYGDGYYPCALLRVRVYAEGIRALTVRLFPDDGTMHEPFVLTESPDRNWLRGLLKQWEPVETAETPVQLG